MEDKPYVLLCARDATIIEAVEVSAAALDISLVVTADNDEIHSSWSAAAIRLISAEVASRWSVVGPGEAVIIGTDAEELARCSAVLKLPVLSLPDDHGHLATLISTSVSDCGGRGTTVCLLGASGGLGTSTVALALAQHAAGFDKAPVVVDLAANSGGLDLLAGIETQSGIRWSELSHARGEAGDIAGSLPSTGGVAILSQDRCSSIRPEPGAVAAVLSSLARVPRLIVIDGGREIVPGNDQVVMVVGADVRSISAARAVASGHLLDGIIVRRGPGRTLSASAVSRALGAPCLSTITHHRGLPKISEIGMLPLSGPTTRFRQEIARLWKELGYARA